MRSSVRLRIGRGRSGTHASGDEVTCSEDKAWHRNVRLFPRSRCELGYSSPLRPFVSPFLHSSSGSKSFRFRLPQHDSLPFFLPSGCARGCSCGLWVRLPRVFRAGPDGPSPPVATVNLPVKRRSKLGAPILRLRPERSCLLPSAHGDGGGATAGGFRRDCHLRDSSDDERR